MDLIVTELDNLFLDSWYPQDNPMFERDAIPRQAITIFFTMWFGGALLYFILASLSYFVFFIWKKDYFHPAHEPQPKPGQVWREIKLALWSMPTMSVLTTPLILLEFHGYSQLYMGVGSYAYLAFSAVLFLLFTDTAIYWIHRLEHEIPFLYKYVHKPHHAWFVPTPFAAIAFHPVDGWLQSLPYHIFPFIFPFHKVLYLGMFIFVQVWTISIHDGVDASLFGFINGSAHHTLHHSKFLYNYGQFFVFWDKFGKTHMDPVIALKNSKAKKTNGVEGNGVEKHNPGKVIRTKISK